MTTRQTYAEHMDELCSKLGKLTKKQLTAVLASELMARYPGTTTGGQFGYALLAVHANWLAAGSPRERHLRVVPGGGRP